MRHPMAVDRVAEVFADPAGLTAAQHAARLARYGPNAIVAPRPHRWLAVIAETARDPMIWFLIGCAVLYAALGQRQEALTLVVALVPLVGMDIYLHQRTEASTEGLGQQLAATATVIRDGATGQVAALDVVPGDLVVVASGELVPADGLVVGGDRIQVDEAALTGESAAVRKRALAAAPAGAGEVRVDGEACAFAGTRVLTGPVQVRVVATGGETLYGAIVASAARTDSQRTPLQVAVAGLVRVLLVIAGLVCVTLAFVRLRQGQGWADAVISAATLAIAVLPEEFPVVLTVFLGVGVFRLARRKALVRRAVCVENIGRVSCICSDKTGTITAGRLTVEDLVPAPGLTVDALLGALALASRADSGDPLDEAVLERARAAPPAVAGARLAEFPFTEDRRRETTIVAADDGPRAVMKGSPEVVLAACLLDDAARARWATEVAAAGARGRKVIAAASRPVELDAIGAEPSTGFTFAGLVTLVDPVRPGVVEAIAACRGSGIRVIMLTGDHPTTAEAIAAEVGLGDAGRPRVATGVDVTARLAGGDAEVLTELDVVARALPAHKLAIVVALQAAGEIVAVTGDGVNDVPALLAADVGIAMGERGTRSAREVAAMVLLDDNFRTIAHAIAEGRQLFRNLQRGFLYLLMVHLPLVVTATLIPLAGYPVLYLPLHVIWLEALIHPTAMLAFQAPAAAAGTDRLGRAPPRRSPHIFEPAQWGMVVAVGVLIAAVIVATYDRSLGPTQDVAHARTMSLAVLTLASATITGFLSRLATAAARWLVAATVASTVALIQVPALARALHLSPLHLDDWGLAVAGAVGAIGVPAAAVAWWPWRRRSVSPPPG
ncbi:MAG: cation-transporting P-type ATPase [Kofleriaceae bacterium]